ncbi:SpoIIE family protein phosphatase [Streptomyces ipomoeae]|nr:SpoIIE family protein phosphatase [Streptomyces ipomoeae]MDX2937757.1 SpoIIE family protein phosphatase [Streptomyces ipomoeae]
MAAARSPREAELSPGPPSAVGGMPFEMTMIDLEPGSTLARCTDGLVDRASRDLDEGTRELLDTLATYCRPDGVLEDIGRAVMADARGAVARRLRPGDWTS